MIHVPPNRVDEHWDAVRAGLLRILEKSPASWRPGDVLCALCSQSAHLALLDGGFMVWQRLAGDDGRGLLFVWAIAGEDMAPKREVLEAELEALARQINAKRIRIMGRPGWGRFPFWQPAGHVFEHEVN